VIFKKIKLTFRLTSCINDRFLPNSIRNSVFLVYNLKILCYSYYCIPIHFEFDIIFNIAAEQNIIQILLILFGVRLEFNLQSNSSIPLDIVLSSKNGKKLLLLTLYVSSVAYLWACLKNNNCDDRNGRTQKMAC